MSNTMQLVKCLKTIFFYGEGKCSHYIEKQKGTPQNYMDIMIPIMLKQAQSIKQDWKEICQDVSYDLSLGWRTRDEFFLLSLYFSLSSKFSIKYLLTTIRRKKPISLLNTTVPSHEILCPGSQLNQRAFLCSTEFPQGPAVHLELGTGETRAEAEPSACTLQTSAFQGP